MQVSLRIKMKTLHIHICTSPKSMAGQGWGPVVSEPESRVAASVSVSVLPAGLAAVKGIEQC